MTASSRPFTLWMQQAKDEQTGEQFLEHVTRGFREARHFDALKVFSGVGRGFTLLRNARKWSHPEVGAGTRTTIAARGRQWRLVMAYGGFEILAKALMCNFKESGAPHVSHFVELAETRYRAVRNPQNRLPLVKPVSVKTLAAAKSLVHDGKADAHRWLRWLSGDDLMDTSIDAVQLSRVIRNLSAHGVLSPDLAIRLGVPALTDALVTALVKVADEVIAATVSCVQS